MSIRRDGSGNLWAHDLSKFAVLRPGTVRFDASAPGFPQSGIPDWHSDMKPYPKHLDWLRYLSAWMLLTYGLAKLAGVQFHAPDVAQRPVSSLSGYQLTWFYYSYSHAYGSILGLVQLTGGILLLFRKIATLGAAMMLPVMINILLINLFFAIGWGAQGIAAFIFASMLALLWRDRAALFGCFWSCQEAEPTNSRRFHRSVAVLIVLLVIAEIVFGLLTRSQT
jgi:hypothetical protein